MVDARAVDVIYGWVAGRIEMPQRWIYREMLRGCCLIEFYMLSTKYYTNSTNRKKEQKLDNDNPSHNHCELV